MTDQQKKEGVIRPTPREPKQQRMKATDVEYLIERICEASNEKQKTLRIDELKFEIDKARSLCGNCKLWMTSDCPREKYSKPSMNSIACEKFKLSLSGQMYIDKMTSELNSMIYPNPKTNNT